LPEPVREANGPDRSKLDSGGGLVFDAAMRIFRLALSSLAAVFAGACDNVVIYYTEQTLPYSVTFVGANIRDGLLPARIFGDPFPGRADAEEIAGALTTPGWMTPARLTTRPTGLTRDLAVVLVFNPAYKDSGMDITCAAGATPPTEPAGGKTLRVAANLCYEGKSISWLYAAGPAPENLLDPKFDKLMSQVMASLLPRSGPR
jgi:hypothetical protein